MYFLDKIKPVFNWDCGFFDYYQLQNSGDASFDEDGYKITAKGVYFSAGRFLDFAELAKCDSFSRALSDINRKFIEENAEKTLLLEQINAEKK